MTWQLRDFGPLELLHIVIDDAEFASYLESAPFNI